MVLRLIRALPGERRFLSPLPRQHRPAWIDATVAAPGPHDFAVRCLRFVGALLRMRALCVALAGKMLEWICGRRSYVTHLPGCSSLATSVSTLTTGSQATAIFFASLLAGGFTPGRVGCRLRASFATGMRIS